MENDFKANFCNQSLLSYQMKRKKIQVAKWGTSKNTTINLYIEHFLKSIAVFVSKNVFNLRSVMLSDLHRILTDLKD